MRILFFARLGWVGMDRGQGEGGVVQRRVGASRRQTIAPIHPFIHPSLCGQLYGTLLTPVHVLGQGTTLLSRSIRTEHAHTVPYRVSRRGSRCVQVFSSLAAAFPVPVPRYLSPLTPGSQ